MDHTHIRPYFLAILITGAFVFTFYLLRPFLGALAMAAIFAVVFTPLHGRITAAVRGHRGIGASLLILLIVLVLAVPLSLFGMRLVSEAEGVFSWLSDPETLAYAQASIVSGGTYADQFVPGASVYLQSLVANIGSYTQSALTWVLGNAAVLFSGAARFLLLTFVFFMALYYLLREGTAVRDSIIRLSPLTPEETNSLLRRMSLTINSVVKGNLTVAALQGFLVGLGFTIFGIPNPVLWGTVAAAGALIPGIGTALVLAPGIAYLFLIGATGPAIGLLIWGVVIVGFVDTFLNPILIGGRASIHPLLILLAVLGGISFFGPAGIFLGPIVISFLLGLLSIYSPAAKEDNSLEEVIVVEEEIATA